MVQYYSNRKNWKLQSNFSGSSTYLDIDLLIKFSLQPLFENLILFCLRLTVKHSEGGPENGGWYQSFLGSKNKYFSRYTYE